VSFAQLSPLGWGGVACVLAMMLLQRPLEVGLATWGMGFSLPQRVVLAWVAPRGVVTAAVASLFAIRLEQAGVLGAGRLQGLVFLTILLTVGLQGLSAGPLARWLGLVEPESDAPATSSSEAGLDARQSLAAAHQQQPGAE
jgi:NhaP-type Na+/H+ or K+/H+ antiporter